MTTDETPADEPQNGRPRRVFMEYPGWAVYALLAIASFFALDAAAEFIVPVVGAFIVYLLLSPLARAMIRAGTPRILAAAIIVPVTVSALGLGVFALAEPAAEWFERTPRLGGEIRTRIRTVLSPVEKVKKATENVEKAAAAATEDSGPKPREVTVKQPSLTERVLAGIRTFGAGFVVVVILTFFFLAYGETFKRRILRSLQGPRGAAQTEALIREVERDVSHYLGTIALINIVLGVLITIGLQVLGFPNAALWGAIAAFANFVPYFGPIVAVGLTAVAGIISAPSIEFAVAGALLHAGINFIEGQFVTPLILGKRFTISPIVIFVAVAFWGWIWGIAGALMAVPIVLILRGLSSRIEGLETLSVILGNKPRTDG